MTAEELLLVKVKFPVSKDVEKLSLGGVAVPKTSGLTTASVGAGPAQPSPVQGNENYAARPIRKAKSRYVGREGKRAFLQKLENANSEGSERQAVGTATIDHQAGDSETDGGDHGVFQVTITFRMADRRRKDIDGMLSTLLDCLVRARRRCLDPNPQDESRSRTVSRRRRRDNHHPKALGPLPF